MSHCDLGVGMITRSYAHVGLCFFTSPLTHSMKIEKEQWFHLILSYTLNIHRDMAKKNKARKKVAEAVVSCEWAELELLTRFANLTVAQVQIPPRT